MRKIKLDPALKRTLSYLAPYKREFFLIGLTLLVSTIVGFLQPLVIRAITDDGMLQQDMTAIAPSTLVLAASVLVNQAIDLWQTRIFADIHNESYYCSFPSGL